MNIESGIDSSFNTNTGIDIDPFSQQSPFGEAPLMISNGSKIEAESFDLGGQDVAYNDLDSVNQFALIDQGNQYRSGDGVDIEATDDDGGGFNVGWVEDGEWLEYTTNVTEGTYNIKARVASEDFDPGSFQVKLGDKLLGTVQVTGTGGWQNWETLTIEGIEITGGDEQLLRLEIQDGGGFNLNWLEFESVDNTFEGDNSFEEDNTSQGDNTFEGDNFFEKNNSFEGDNSFEVDNTSEGNNTSQGDNTSEGNNTSQAGDFQEISADNENFHYEGRINQQNPQAPTFSYPRTAVEFQFTGTSLKVKLTEDNWGGANYVDVFLDDNPEPTTINLEANQQPVVYDVAQGLEDTVHKAVLVKRNDFEAGEFQFQGVILDPGESLVPLDPKSDRKIEVYGDSISAGKAVEYELTGTQDPPGDNLDITNANLSYASLLAEEYDAELSLVAQAGASLVDGYGFWNEGTGMEAIYDKFAPIDDAAAWDFDNYDPDLVIVALGQNDSATVNIGSDLSSAEWKNRYKQFIADLRAEHPDAYFIGMFPNMFHGTEWDNYLTEAVDEYKNETNDDKVYSLIQEQVTPGHPRESEQQAMADTLKNFIDTTLVADGFKW